MTKNNKIIPKDYKSFLTQVKYRIRQSQLKALKSVNKELIILYWDLGKLIVERQEKYKWGDSVIENLSKDLQNEFQGIRGFSVQNLWYMRKLYLTYYKKEKLQSLIGEISWTHNLAIMDKCKDCEYIPRCGGCRAMAYSVTGDYLAEDPQCWKQTKLIV